MSSAIDHIPEIWQTFDEFPQTLIHNDCNPRNICLRKGGNFTGELYIPDYIVVVVVVVICILFSWCH